MPNDAIMDRIEREAAEKLARASERWQQLYADWIQACADYYRPIPETIKDDAGHHEQRTEKLRVITRDLMTTPADLGWMVWNKISVFEHFLYDGGEYSEWTDRRDVWMLGCIKADLMRQGIGRES